MSSDEVNIDDKNTTGACFVVVNVIRSVGGHRVGGCMNAWSQSKNLCRGRRRKSSAT